MSSTVASSQAAEAINGSADVGITIQDVEMTAAVKKYDSFMDGLLSPFPAGNIASRSLKFSWIRWSGSVFPRVWPAVVFWTLYSTVIILLAELLGWRATMSAPSTAVVSLIGFAASLLLGFRTNSAYERWYEGRKLFEIVCSRVRDIVRYWTICFPPKTPEDRGLQIAACRAAVAYVYALMYHLRDEDPLDHDDCTDLIPRTKNGNLAIESDNPETQRFYFEQAHRVVQISGIAHHSSGTARKTMTSFRLPGSWKNPRTYAVPNQILSLIYKYNNDTAGAPKSASGFFNDLSYAQISLERILSTPMPQIYSIHLKMVLTVFFICIPFQFMNWSYFGIPLMAIAAFVMWGFESMGLELENPFGYDANDLPLSEICATLRREIDFMAEHPVANMSDWESVVTNVSAEQLEKEMRMENALDGAQADKTFKLLSKKQAEAGKMV